MSQNEKRRKFIEQFIVDVSQIERKQRLQQFVGQAKGIRDEKFFEQNEKMKPTMGEIADGYRGYIYDLGEGFLEVVETYNECLQIAKLYGIVENIKVKARIKDFSSSTTNTDIKLLDDVFGMEVVTGRKLTDSELENPKLKKTELEKSEFEKEVLVLFNHLIFNISKDKILNKKNGYNAYHGMGDFSPKQENLKKTIKNIVNETKTREYKYLKSEPKYDDKKNMVNVFPRLAKYINNKDNLNKLTEVLEEMIEYMSTIKTPTEGMPIIEFHFLTSVVEHEAIKGGANHFKYKKINPKLIEEYFLNGRLIRGINAPWKFESQGDKMVLQDFYTTLEENWPFLSDEIEQKRKLGKEQREGNRISKFDRLTATQFSFLRKYLDETNRYDEKTEENWGLLKAILIANRINFNDESLKPIEDEIIDYLAH